MVLPVAIMIILIIIIMIIIIIMTMIVIIIMTRVVTITCDFCIWPLKYSRHYCRLRCS